MSATAMTPLHSGYVSRSNEAGGSSQAKSLPECAEKVLEFVDFGDFEKTAGYPTKTLSTLSDLGADLGPLSEFELDAFLLQDRVSLMVIDYDLETCDGNGHGINASQSLWRDDLQNELSMLGDIDSSDTKAIDSLLQVSSLEGRNPSQSNDAISEYSWEDYLSKFDDLVDSGRSRGEVIRKDIDEDRDFFAEEFDEKQLFVDMEPNQKPSTPSKASKRLREATNYSRQHSEEADTKLSEPTRTAPRFQRKKILGFQTICLRR